MLTGRENNIDTFRNGTRFGLTIEPPVDFKLNAFPFGKLITHLVRNFTKNKSITTSSAAI